MRAIRNGMEAARVPVEFSKGEWGRGQEEINLRYADALEMADRHVLYKHGVKEIAWQQGCSVTFMAKYDMGAAGSSFHLHSSLWDQAGRRNLFAAKGGSRGAPRSSSSGSAARWRWPGSWPTSTRRPSTPTSATRRAPSRRRASPGAGTTAPAASASAARAEASGWRTASRGRTPIRTWPSRPTIAAGLHGIEKKLAPPPMFEGNAYERAALPEVPKTLRDALAELERSEVARAAFGPRWWTTTSHGRLEQQACSTSRSPTGS